MEELRDGDYAIYAKTAGGIDGLTNIIERPCQVQSPSSPPENFTSRRTQARKCYY